MKALALQFTRNGWAHRQITRSGNLAIYERSRPESPAPHYELVHIRQNKDREQFGRVIPASESYPPETAWGSHGWTFQTLSLAKARMTQEQAKAAEKAGRNSKAEALN